MGEVSYIDVWRIWFAGKETSTYVLWGIELLWWGRVGKIVQLIAALTVIAEIIGPDKLRSFGESLHPKTTRTLSARFDRATTFYGRVADFPLGNWLLLLITMMLTAGMFQILNAMIGLPNSKWLLIPFFILSLVMGVTVGFLFILIVMSIGLIIDVCIIRPIVKLLETTYLDKVIKVFSIIVLLVGFHFDLLAS